MDKVS